MDKLGVTSCQHCGKQVHVYISDTIKDRMLQCPTCKKYDYYLIGYKAVNNKGEWTGDKDGH